MAVVASPGRQDLEDALRASEEEFLRQADIQASWACGILVAEKIAEFIKTSTEKSRLVPGHSEVDRFFQEQAALAAAMEASYVWMPSL